MLTEEATDCGGGADCPAPDFDGADVLDAVEGVAVVDLATAGDALAVAGAPPATVAALVEGADLVELVAAAIDLPGTAGVTVEMPLICMIANL